MKLAISYVAAITLHLLALFCLKAPAPPAATAKAEPQYVELTLAVPWPEESAAAVPASAPPDEIAEPSAASANPAAEVAPEPASPSVEAAPAEPADTARMMPDAAAPDSTQSPLAPAETSPIPDEAPPAAAAPSAPESSTAPEELAPVPWDPYNGPVEPGNGSGGNYGPRVGGGGTGRGSGSRPPVQPGTGLGPGRLPGGRGGGTGGGGGVNPPRRAPPPPRAPLPPPRRAPLPAPRPPPGPIVPTRIIGSNPYFGPGYVIGTQPPPPRVPVGGPVALMPATATEPAHYFQAFVLAGGIGWVRAQDFATTHGGYLAIIKTAEVNDFVFQLVTDKKHWKNVTGAWDTDSLGPWLGGRQNDDRANTATSNWTWSNGRAFTYTNWSANNLSHTAAGVYSLLFYGAGRNHPQPTWSPAPPTMLAPSFVVEYDKDPAAQARGTP